MLLLLKSIVISLSSEDHGPQLYEPTTLVAATPSAPLYDLKCTTCADTSPEKSMPKVNVNNIVAIYLYIFLNLMICFFSKLRIFLSFSNLFLNNEP